ncbi:ParB/RepB/Spo0J family partition protein [Acidithiobacillus ferriphilus]|uniref:ParB/RepB/Spo0J family partition protein n=1 Tax=Acidithiobacillus ferriphilus TaxID=1689834 RepID=UPI002DBD390A|nr:ParB/RepB/Spo0J family partition protein [Acidithiobacillus ferriphilus]MEB8475921.1 ParB/RepB/Spo0J family partition protein [Acidithiobacillus ferriphilus]
MAKQPFRRMGVIHPIPSAGLTPPPNERVRQEMEDAAHMLAEPPAAIPIANNDAEESAAQPGNVTVDGHHPEEAAQYQVDISLLYPGRFQPRFSISQEGIDDLASDIDRIGKLLNPVNVRPDDCGRYEIIAGERRWRACTLLGWQKIPVTLIGNDEKMAIMASLSENIQRQDLSEMEIGLYLKRMLDEGIAPTKRELAVKVGIDRRSLYKYLAFTELSPSLQQTIRQAPSLFAAYTAEIMVDLCRNGHTDRVQQAAHLITQGKLNTSTMRAWVTGHDRSRDPERRPIVRDGVRVGTVSFGKDEMRIRLSPGIQDIPQEELAAMISAAILSRSEGDAMTIMNATPHAVVDQTLPDSTATADPVIVTDERDE